VDRASPTALHANGSDMLNVEVSMSTARLLAAGLRIFHLAQGILFQLGLGQQPLESGVRWCMTGLG
jgi:hypothetical protein